MAVVSAGSLCAGYRELPRGVNRQYNLIVINDDYTGARVHVREMVEGGHFSRKSGHGFLQGYTDISWQVSLDPAGRNVDVVQQNERRAIEQAELSAGHGEWSAAVNHIRRARTPIGSYARKIAVEAALRSEDWPFLKTLLAGSTSDEEVAILISALTHLGELDEAEQILAGAVALEEPLRRSLTERIAIQRLMKGPR
jgi:hypothetical protein